MRLIGHLDNEGNARAFGDYLYVQGIENEIEPESNGACAIWVIDEDAVAKAVTLLNEFRQNPGNPEYRRHGKTAEQQRALVEKENQEAKKRIIKARQLFPEMRPYGVGPVTCVLILACVLVAIYSKLGKNIEPILGLYISERANPAALLPEVRHGEIWRLFTPMLVHFGPIHLLFNMMWLFQLGSLIESRNGSSYFMTLVLVIAGLSNVVQYFLGGAGFGGMSGVVYGLFGFIWMRAKYDPASGYFMNQQTVVMMIIWLFLCIFIISGIANGVHVSGLAVGVAWGYLAALANRPSR